MCFCEHFFFFCLLLQNWTYIYLVHYFCSMGLTIHNLILMHLAHQRALNKVINSQSKKQKSSLMFLLTCTHLFLDRKKAIFIEFLFKVSYGWRNSQPLYHLDPNQRCMILTFSVNWYTVYLVLFRMSQNLRRGNICNIFILRVIFLW